MKHLFCLIFLLIFPHVSAFSEPLKVGFVVPLTGPASIMGESLNGVIKLARLKNISAQFEDDRCEGKTALSAYYQLRKRGVRIFFMACSGSILAVAPLAKRNGDLILTTYAGSAKIRDTGTEVIRLNPDAISIAEALAKLVNSELTPTLILYEEQDYAESLANSLQSLLGSSIKSRISYRPDSTSFSSEILKVKQERTNSIILIPVADGAAQRILRQVSLSGISVPVIGDVNLCDYPFHPSDFGLKGFCVSARFGGKSYEDFLDEYHIQVRRRPAYPFYDAIALDLLKFLDEMSEREPEAVRTVLLKGFKGEFAKYSFTDEGEVENGGDYLTVIRY